MTFLPQCSLVTYTVHSSAIHSQLKKNITKKHMIILKYWDLLGPHAAHGLQVEHNWSQVLDLSFLTEIVYVIDPQQMLLVHLFCMAAKWTKTFLIRQLTFQVYDFSSTNELFYQLTLILPTYLTFIYTCIVSFLVCLRIYLWIFLKEENGSHAFGFHFKAMTGVWEHSSANPANILADKQRL